MALEFALRLSSVGAREFNHIAVLLPQRALHERYRAIGLPFELTFHPSPAGWKDEKDGAGSCDEDTAARLVAAVSTGSERGRRTAMLLLGPCGPRTPEVVDAIAGNLTRPALSAAALTVLPRLGYAARRALPALRNLARSEAARAAIRAIEATRHPGLLDPDQARDRAPDRFRVRLETSAGEVPVEVTRAWAPLGADQFYNLVRVGFFDGVRIHRVVAGFCAQFGKSPYAYAKRHYPKLDVIRRATIVK